MNYREEVIRNYATWTAIAALRSGKHIKDGESLSDALNSIVDLSKIPTEEEEFDEWHKTTTKKLRSKVLKHRTKNRNDEELEFSIGWAAKLLNVYLKTLFYVGDLKPKELRRMIHPPIDNILVDKLSKNHGVSLWNTKEKFSIQRIERYDQYSKVISALKKYCGDKKFENFMDVEYIWNAVRLKKESV